WLRRATTSPPGRMPHGQRSLADGELRIGADAGDAGPFRLDAVAVGGLESVERGPLLPLPADVLAFLAADNALIGRDGAFRVLGAAGGADEGGHRAFESRVMRI